MGRNILTFDMDRNFDLLQARKKHVNAKYLKCLINVVPTTVAGDRAGRYYVGWFVIQMYCKLLDE